MSKNYFAPAAWLPDGWASNVLLTVGDHGKLSGVVPDQVPGNAERLNGPVIPGMANLHSHAFQRALAGLAETKGAPSDSFWTWRKIMYAFLEQLNPDHVSMIAKLLYLEMVKAGYTSVGEFHYLHHGVDGVRYDNPFQMSETVIGAAREVGIAITHLPVLYMTGDFDERPLEGQQSRFATTPDWILDLVSTLSAAHSDDPHVNFGVAPHSLRAVPKEPLRDVVSGLQAIDASAPVHVHISEQMKEVDACLAAFGRRPIEHLYDMLDVDQRFCLIHATHANAAEIESIAKSGAIAGICPTTEGNLGDGLFPMADFRALGGGWGIGADSHVSISPVEELRWLEYGQRLIMQSRAVIASDAVVSVGASLWAEACVGGHQALGRKGGAIAPGYVADLVVLDEGLLRANGGANDRLMDRAIFAGNINPVSDVLVGGDWVVRDGRHELEDAITAEFQAINDLVTNF